MMSLMLMITNHLILQSKNSSLESMKLKPRVRMPWGETASSVRESGLGTTAPSSNTNFCDLQ